MPSGVTPTVIIHAFAPLWQAGSSDPFFTNDAVGFIKVLAFFAGIAGVIIGTLVKVTSSGFKNDLTNVGQKLDAHIRTHEREITRMDAKVAAIEKDVEGTTRDITTLITATAGEHAKQMTELQVELARMQERDRLAEQLHRFRDEGRTSRGEKK